MTKKIFALLMAVMMLTSRASAETAATAAVQYRELVPGNEWYHTFTSPFGITGMILSGLSIYSGFKLVHKVVNDYSFADTPKTDERKLQTTAPLWVGLGLIAIGGIGIYLTQTHVGFIKQGAYLDVPRS